MAKFKKGDKVFPIAKRHSGSSKGSTLEQVLMAMKLKDVLYLTVQDAEYEYYIKCSPVVPGASFHLFYEEELVPYIVKQEKIEVD